MSNERMKNLAYHFTADKLRDGSPIPPIGHTLVFSGQIEICERGYHWSKEPFDTLRYALGNMLHLVQYGGDVQEGTDKGCSSERTIVKSIDATYLLRRFSADQALSVAHLWQMPEIVRNYLTTLDDTKQTAAWAARAAGTAAAASWDAAQAAAQAAARAASAAASAAAEAAEWAAAAAAARAAGAAEWAAARTAARAAARKEFNLRVAAAFELKEMK